MTTRNEETDHDHHQHRSHRAAGPGVIADLPLWRLNLMRVGYTVMGIGLAAVKWPDVIAYDHSISAA
jgi:hypothetical protein